MSGDIEQLLESYVDDLNKEDLLEMEKERFHEEKQASKSQEESSVRSMNIKLFGEMLKYISATLKKKKKKKKGCDSPPVLCCTLS
jgi:hypothetical protein